MGEHVLEVERISKNFPGTEALSDVSLTVDKGQIVGLLGPNGSGKSTLLKCITGLYKPDRGMVRVLGETPSQKTKAKIAYLPEVNHLYGWMSVRQLVNFMEPFYPDWQQDRACELLDFMQLSPEKKVATLSKGMKARLKIVLTMARKAPLVLMDEPLSGIDPASRGRILEAILNEFHEEQSLVISTHEVGDSESLFDWVLFLQDGRIRLLEKAENLRQEHGLSINDLFKEAYR